MPTAIPYNPVPTVNPDGRGIGYLSVPNATAEAFGAGIGNALQGFAKNVSGAADEIFQTSMKLQQQTNEAGARDSTAQGIVRINNIRAEFESKQGANAIDAYPQYQTDIKAAREEILAGAANPAQRRMIDAELSRTYTWAISGGATYTAGQSRKYAAEQRQALQTGLEQDAAGAASYDEWKSKADGLVNTSRENMAAVAGSPPEQLELLGKTARTKSFADWIKLQADADPKAAYDIFEKEKANLTPNAAVTIGNYLRQRVQSQATVTIAGQAATGMPIEAPKWGTTPNSLQPAGTPGGKLTAAQVFGIARDEVTRQGLVGTVPIDGPKYGIKTGSADEWGRLLEWISAAESSHNNNDSFKEPGMYDSSGRQVYSRGLYSLSEQDGPNHGLNSGQRFTTQQLADPHINTAAAVAIVKRLVAQSGSIEGLKKYWSTLRDGRAAATLGGGGGFNGTAASYAPGSGNSVAGTARGVPPMNFDAAIQHQLTAYPLTYQPGISLQALTPGMPESDFLANRALLESHLREEVFKGPMDQKLIDATLSNYDARFQRMQQQYKTEQDELGKQLLAHVNGYSSITGGNDKPLISLEELRADPKLSDMYERANVNTKSAIEVQLRRNQAADDRDMSPEDAQLAGVLEGKIRNGIYVSPDEIANSGISRGKQNSLLAMLSSRGQDDVTGTKMFQNYFPNLMETQFGIRRNTDAYAYVFSQVHDALAQAKPDGKMLDPQSMQAIVTSKLGELYKENPEIFSAAKEQNITLAPQVSQHLSQVIKNKGSRDAAVQGIQAAGAMVGNARVLPPAAKVDMQRALIDTQIAEPGALFGTNSVPLAKAYAPVNGQPSPLVAAGVQPGTAVQIVRDFVSVNRRAPTVNDIYNLARQPNYAAMNKRLFTGMSNGY